MYLLFLRISLVIKGVALLGFISCFISNAPHLSFNAYFSVVACCYFYIGAMHMESWGPTFRMIKTLLVLNGLLITAQFFTQDQLLNFGLEKISSFGVVGHHMQEASFLVVLTALLIQIHPAFFVVPMVAAVFCNSTWALICVAVGLWVYFPNSRIRKASLFVLLWFFVMGWVTQKFKINLSPGSGRLQVWLRSIELLNHRPWTGWGPGTYKFIFPSISGIKGVPWKTAHNCWIQFPFEVGYPLFGIMVTTVSCTYLRLHSLYKRTGNTKLMAGFSMIACNMLVHFPTRTTQCVLLILLFLAFCDLRLRHRRIKLT
jgi:O-antigen ligase